MLSRDLNFGVSEDDNRGTMVVYQKHHLLLLTLPLLAAALTMSCGLVQTEIDTVRNGILANYNTTTVGKAFEGTFQNAKWTSFVSPKGVTVVQFNGTLQPERLLQRVTADLLMTNNILGGYAETRRQNCTASLQLGDTLAQLKRQGEETDQEYQAKAQTTLKTVSQQFSAIAYRGYTYGLNKGYDIRDLHNFNPYDNEPVAYSIEKRGDVDVFPFHDLFVAWRAELEAEKRQFAAADAKIADCMNSTPIAVKFQFVLSADKNTFQCGYVDEAFESQEEALSFIYR
jgi:hypothetical protein